MIDAIDVKASEMLIEMGFRRGGSLLAKEITTNIVLVVGLVKTEFNKDDTPWIAPTIGVVNVDVEELLSSITDDPFNGFSPVTVSSPIGYLMPDPDYRKWYFDENISARITDMCKCINNYGNEFAESVQEPEDLLRKMLGGMGIKFMNWYRIPLLYVVTGDFEGAKRYMKQVPPRGLYDLSPNEFAERLFKHARERGLSG